MLCERARVQEAAMSEQDPTTEALEVTDEAVEDDPIYGMAQHHGESPSSESNA
jgi:hypothetical protein